VGLIDKALMRVAPGLALSRARSRLAYETLMHYRAAQAGDRGSSWRPSRGDADASSARRDRLAAIARDMVRNTPFAVRAQQVISGNVVGDGIIPKPTGGTKAARAEALRLIEAHFDTTAIDADGRNTLYGLQRLAMNTVIDAGEVLIRRRRRQRSDGYPLPFQLQVLEPDFLDRMASGPLPNGHLIREGIEYDAIGRRVAYHLLAEHPGARGWARLRGETRRVPASEILHLYRQDRPGQMRGVSWFAPVALTLQDLDDHQDAQLMRQKIAACFAAFRVRPDDEPTKDGVDPAGLGSIAPGRIQTMGPGEDIRFSAPPGVEAYDEFTRTVLRSAAAGMGITYEALSGDLSRVNFSSARMGRLEMDRNVSGWQWHLLIPQFCQPLGAWFSEAWMMSSARAGQVRLEWTPPARVLIDPAREIAAQRDKVRAGFASRQASIRELGFDPERVIQEQAEDAAEADARGLVFDSDPRRVALSGVMHSGTGPDRDTENGGSDG